MIYFTQIISLYAEKRNFREGRIGICRDRLKKIRQGLKKSGADGVLLTDLVNIRYLTGFTGSNGYLLLTARGGWFFTDSRYTAQAASEVEGFTILRLTGPWFKEIAAKIKGLSVGRLGFEGANLSYTLWKKLKDELKGLRLKDISGLVESVRIGKDSEEIKEMREAIRIASLGFQEARLAIRPGVSEGEVARRIESVLRDNGATGPSFDIIVASGARGALPHGIAGEKKIKKGELVIVDMGALYKGYSSDETRTYAVGRASKKAREVYRIVKDAHDLAIEAVRPGVKVSDIDKAARDYIKDAGYGEFFGHGTGHGVGLNIHEAPSVSPAGREILSKGMIFTVEPGIYLEGEFGVRIEDMILVTGDGFEVLTRSGRDLEVLS